MIITSDFFTAKELKLRKRWLISMFVMLGFSILQVASLTLEDPNPLQLFVILSLVNLVVFWLLYHFSYKKNGYQLLLMILLIPFTQMKEIMSAFQSMPIQNGIGLVILFASLGLYGWWYYISLKLIELHTPLNPSRKCRKALAEMEASQTIEDLDLKFHKLVNEFSKFERVITKAYHEKKESLIRHASSPALGN
jgi:hypothetical protein